MSPAGTTSPAFLAQKCMHSVRSGAKKLLAS
jgi:hypothetical protein